MSRYRLSEKDVEVIEALESNPDFPERRLWLAIIERAVIDYAVAGIPTRSRIGKNKVKHWLFDDKARPNNLVFICRLLFDDDNGAVQAIRKRAQEMREEVQNGIYQHNTIPRRVPRTAIVD